MQVHGEKFDFVFLISVCVWGGHYLTSQSDYESQAADVDADVPVASRGNQMFCVQNSSGLPSGKLIDFRG